MKWFKNPLKRKPKETDQSDRIARLEAIIENMPAKNLRNFILRLCAKRNPLINLIIDQAHALLMDNAMNQAPASVSAHFAQSGLVTESYDLTEASLDWDAWNRDEVGSPTQQRMAMYLGQNGFDEAWLDAVRADARWMAKFNPLYHAIIHIYKAYIVGTKLGVKVFNNDKDGTADRDSQKVIDEWMKKNSLEALGRETVERAYRDGEAIIFFMRRLLDSEGNVTKVVYDDGSVEKKLDFAIRFKEPEHMRSIEKTELRTWLAANPQTIKGLTAAQIDERSFTFGIETLESDPQTIFAYWFTYEDKDKRKRFERIPAASIIHWKVNCDSNSKRGAPELLAETRAIRNFDAWMANRQAMQLIRTAVAMVVYRDNEYAGQIETEINAEADDFETSTNQSGAVLTVPKKVFEAGSVMQVPLGWKVEQPKISAGGADADFDCKAQLRQISVSRMMPDFWITGDASATSYSSQQVALLHGGVGMYPRQEEAMEIMSKVVKQIIRGTSGTKAKELEEKRVEVAGPEVPMQSPLDQAKSYEIYNRIGAIDPETVAVEQGWNYEEVQAGVAKQRTELAAASGTDSGIGATRQQPKAKPKPTKTK